MKKHYIIIGILLVAALFFIPVLINSNSEETAGGTKEPPTESNLNERIEEIGNQPWSREDYEELINEIIGYASDQQISVSERDNYRYTLNINMQKALALSFEKSLSESCYSDNMDNILASSDTISNPIKELTKQKNIYYKYIKVLGYKNRLNSFLSDKYTDVAAINLKSAYQMAYSNEPFRNCSKIQNLKLEIAKKTNRLRDFQADFEIIITKKVENKEYPDFDYYNDDPDLLSELKKYNYYYQEFLSLQNK